MGEENCDLVALALSWVKMNFIQILFCLYLVLIEATFAWQITMLVEGKILTLKIPFGSRNMTTFVKNGDNAEVFGGITFAYFTNVYKVTINFTERFPFVYSLAPNSYSLQSREPLHSIIVYRDKGNCQLVSEQKLIYHLHFSLERVRTSSD